MKDIPVIEVSSLSKDRILCNGCGTYDPDGQIVQTFPVQQYTLRTGSTSAFTIAWCSLCAKKVALLLLEETLFAKPLAQMTLYGASLGTLEALRQFYEDHLGPDPQINDAQHKLVLQVSLAREHRDPNYEGLREPLAQLIPLVQSLIAVNPAEETTMLTEALTRIEPIFR